MTFSIPANCPIVLLEPLEALAKRCASYSHHLSTKIRELANACFDGSTIDGYDDAIFKLIRIFQLPYNDHPALQKCLRIFLSRLSGTSTNHLTDPFEKCLLAGTVSGIIDSFNYDDILKKATRLNCVWLQHECIEFLKTKILLTTKDFLHHLPILQSLLFHPKIFNYFIKVVVRDLPTLPYLLKTKLLNFARGENQTLLMLIIDILAADPEHQISYKDGTLKLTVSISFFAQHAFRLKQLVTGIFIRYPDTQNKEEKCTFPRKVTLEWNFIDYLDEIHVKLILSFLSEITNKSVINKAIIKIYPWANVDWCNLKFVPNLEVNCFGINNIINISKYEILDALVLYRSERKEEFLFSSNKAITTFGFIGIHRGEDLKFLTQQLLQLPNLKRLRISNVLNIDNFLHDIVPISNHLTYLDFTNCKFQDNFLTPLKKVLEAAAPHLTTLNLFNTQLTIQKLILLEPAFAKMGSLKILVLSHNSLQKKDPNEHWRSLLAPLTQLSNLSMAQCGLLDKNILDISKVISVFLPRLKYLNLAQNFAKGAGAKALAESLHRTWSLKHLNVRGNPLTIAEEDFFIKEVARLSRRFTLLTGHNLTQMKMSSNFPLQ